MRVIAKWMSTLVALGLLAAATPARAANENTVDERADFALALGMKWIPLSYTKPISVTGGAAGPSPVTLYGWQQTSLDNYLGAFFLDGRLGFQVGFDFGYGSVHHDTTTGGINMNAGDQSFTQFGFSLGGKFYFTAPRRQRVSPYLMLDFFKYFASVSTNDKAIPNDQAGYVAGLASPVGFDAALGAEFFFTPAFSIGAEVLGLKLAYVQGDYSVGDTRFNTTEKYLTAYCGITLNYRFLISGTVRVRESDEGEEGHTRRRPPRPPVEGSPPPPQETPPPSPESVD